MKSGIYKWTNKETGSVYIGQAKDLRKRMKDFLNFNTQYAGKRINEERIKYPDLRYWDYDILEECDTSELNQKENKYITEYKGAILLNITGNQPKKLKPEKRKTNTPEEILRERIIQVKDNFSGYDLTNFQTLVNLIHDERNIIIDTKIHNIGGLLYDTVDIEIHPETYNAYDINNNIELWARFVNLKLLRKGLKSYWGIPYYDEYIDFGPFLEWKCTNTKDYPKHLTVNKTFFETTFNLIEK